MQDGIFDGVWTTKKKDTELKKRLANLSKHQMVSIESDA